jgi:3-phenylpropionate/trans-cinnamate dioxygenase ferredoxin reductase subunit
MSAATGRSRASLRRSAQPAADVVIVGAGQAGGNAAQALRAAGHAGSITLIGAEAHPPYERPPLSKGLLEGSADIESTYLRPFAWYAANGISLRLGREATRIDRGAQRVELDDGSSAPYDALVLCTGARPRTLALPGADSPAVHYLRDIGDAMALRERLVSGTRLAIIGGGFVGLEAAAAARRLGVQVTLLELSPQLLARVAPVPVADFFGALHRANGVAIHTGVQVEAVEHHGRQARLRTADGATIEADTVLAGIGSVPNVALAEAAGLACRDGILVDAFGRSSDPCIWAAGDVATQFNPILQRHVRLESWQNAQNQAAAVGRCIAGGCADPHAELPWFWSDQYDVNFQMIGLAAQGDRLVLRGRIEDRRFTLFHLRNGVPVAAAAVNNGREIRAAAQLILAARAIDTQVLADPRRDLRSIAKEAQALTT